MEPLHPSYPQNSSQTKGSLNVSLVLLVLFVLGAIITVVLGIQMGYVNFNPKEYSAITESDLVETQTGSQNANNSVNVESSFDKARTLLVEGLNKWDSLERVSYVGKGGDGDEIPWMEVENVYDFENDEYDIKYKFPTEPTEPPFMPIYYGRGYLKKNGLVFEYKFTGEKNENLVEIEEENLSDEHSLIEIKSRVLGNLEQYGNYNVVSSVTPGIYRGENVSFVNISFYKKSQNTSFLNKFKVYADIDADNFSINAVIDNNGNIVELEAPYHYSRMQYLFDYISTVNISLPETK